MLKNTSPLVRAKIVFALKPFISHLWDSCTRLVRVTPNHGFNWPLISHEEKILGQVGHTIKGGQVKSMCHYGEEELYCAPLCLSILFLLKRENKWEQSFWVELSVNLIYPTVFAQILKLEAQVRKIWSCPHTTMIGCYIAYYSVGNYALCFISFTILCKRICSSVYSFKMKSFILKHIWILHPKISCSLHNICSSTEK